MLGKSVSGGPDASVFAARAATAGGEFIVLYERPGERFQAWCVIARRRRCLVIDERTARIEQAVARSFVDSPFWAQVPPIGSF
jgi:hypothetical protein